MPLSENNGGTEFSRRRRIMLKTDILVAKSVNRSSSGGIFESVGGLLKDS